MAKFTNIKRIVTEDFPQEDQETISKLGYVINNAFEQLVQAFNKNLTIQDNLNQNIINIDINVTSAGTPTIGTQIRFSTNGLKGMQVINVSNLSNPALYPTSQPFVSYEILTNNLFVIKNITGLQPNNTYRLSLLVIGG